MKQKPQDCNYIIQLNLGWVEFIALHMCGSYTATHHCLISSAVIASANGLSELKINQL